METLEFIGLKVLEPTFANAGAVLNVLAFCIWVFGPKSKSLCCATYFAANAVADFLLLTIRPIYLEKWIIHIAWSKTEITCKIFRSLFNGILQVSTWLSAAITAERALTIILPFVFKSQDMSRRSKYIIAIIVVVQPITQILNLMYFTGSTDPRFNYCTFLRFSDIRTVDSLRVWLEVVIPFAVTIP